MNDLHQIGTLVRLKGRLTFRSYARDTLAIIQSILFALTILVFASFFGFGIVMTFYYLRIFLNFPQGDEIEIMLLANLLWGIYIFWILVPAFGFRLNESYDISKLLHLPVKKVTLFIAGVVGAFTDVAVAIPLAGLAGILILFSHYSDVAAISLPLIGFDILVLLIYMLNMILAGQLVVILIYNYLPRIPFYITGGVIAGFCYVIYNAWFAIQTDVGHAIHIFDLAVGERLYIYFPHGLATWAIYDAYSGAWDQTLWGLGWLLLHTAVLGTITGILFARWHSAGNMEGTSGGDDTRRHRSIADAVAAFWSRVLKPVLPVKALEVMRKDHLQLLRSRNFVLYKTVPSIVGPGVVMFAIWYSTSHYRNIENSPDLVSCFIGAAMLFSLFVVTAQANLFAGNLFGLEGRGIYALFSTAADRRDILLGKDTFLLTLFLFDALIFGGFTWLLLSSQLLWAPAAGMLMALLLFNLFTLLVATGNFTSALMPYYYDLERPAVSAQQVILLALVEGLAATSAFILMLPIMFLLAVPFMVKIPLLLIATVPMSLTYSFLWLWLSVRLAGPIVRSMEIVIMERVSEP